MSTPAAEYPDDPIDLAQLTDSEKIEIMREQLAWLCWHVENMLKMASSTPMGRMAMAQMTKKVARNG